MPTSPSLALIFVVFEMARCNMSPQIVVANRGVCAVLLWTSMFHDLQPATLGYEPVFIVPLRLGRLVSIEALLLGRGVVAPSSGASERFGVLVGVGL